MNYFDYRSKKINACGKCVASKGQKVKAFHCFSFVLELVKGHEIACKRT